MPAVRSSSNWSEAALLGGGIVIVLCLGAFDLWTGPELSFSIFYLLPIYLLTWLLDRWAGVFISVVSALAWFAADFMAGHTYSQPLIPYWNAAVRLSFFLITAYLLSRLKTGLKLERALARTDPLTQVANGKHFYTLAEAEIASARVSGSPLTIAYLDVDDFKSVNDRWGHHAGDRLLCLIAATVQRGLRPTDIIARIGGDEFALLLPDTGIESAQQILSAVRGRVGDRVQHRGWPITLSMGAVTFVQPAESVDEMLGHADRLMYDAKREGKDGIRYAVHPSPADGCH
jgi:diguanylate cyclase (GGDEF)-like protein